MVKFWRVPLMVRRSVSQSDNSSSILLRATLITLSPETIAHELPEYEISIPV